MVAGTKQERGKKWMDIGYSGYKKTCLKDGLYLGNEQEGMSGRTLTAGWGTLSGTVTDKRSSVRGTGTLIIRRWRYLDLLSCRHH